MAPSVTRLKIGSGTAIVMVAFGDWSTFVIDRDSGALIHRDTGELGQDHIRKHFTKPAEEEPDAALLG